MLFQQFCSEIPLVASSNILHRTEMITFMDSKEELKEVENCLDPQLWHACAGGMFQMPSVNSKVFYFPQGHAEHACQPVDFRAFTRIPPFILCRVSAIKFMADQNDDVYAKIKLFPVNINEPDFADDGIGGINGNESQDKPVSFAKTLTQSDANNGGGFSVPRYCAETIFPRLDYSADPPVQTILAKDVLGETWKFRHIYRGTPRRHLLTTGWSTFVNHKRLVAGDSIVFLRAENGDLCVGIRRAKRGTGVGTESSAGWNPVGGNGPVPYGGFSDFLRDSDNKLLRNGNNSNGLSPKGSMKEKRKVTAKAVTEAASLAANGQPFEVVFYPRAGTPEFCVKASLVKAAWQISWRPGLKFKMPFETEDSTRISWFMGTISSVQPADPLRWPDSPWRNLQVTWDEPDLLQNVKRVSPWLVELAPTVASFHLSSFSPPRKKLRLPQHPDFPLDGQIPIPSFSGNLLGPSHPFGYLRESTPAGMQGARHAHYHFGLSLPDFHLNKLQSGQFPAGFPPLDHSVTPMRVSDHPPLHQSVTPTMVSNHAVVQKPGLSENVSFLQSMKVSTRSLKKPDDEKKPQLVLFGQKILTEQQISLSCSGDSSSDGSALHQQGLPDHFSCERFPCYKDNCHETESNLETGHCKVFIESEDVGRTMDLSLLGSFDELYRKLADMFSIEKSEMLSRVIYRNVMGAVKHIGDEPFSDFTKTARRLTILMDSSSDNLGA